MPGFTKIFSSITTSTIWGEDGDTCKIWVTLLSQANAKGETDITIPGLSRMTLIPIKKCEEAMEKFQQPDKYSRSQEKEGRRIEKIDGGWLIINYKKYRDTRDPDVRREQNRRSQQTVRDRKKSANNQPIISEGKPGSAQAEAEAEAEADTNIKPIRVENFDKAIESMKLDKRFDEFKKMKVNVEQEILDARDWIWNEPHKGVKKNYKTFITNWMKRARDNIKNNPKSNKNSKVGDFENVKVGKNGELPV